MFEAHVDSAGQLFGLTNNPFEIFLRVNTNDKITRITSSTESPKVALGLAPVSFILH